MRVPLVASICAVVLVAAAVPTAWPAQATSVEAELHDLSSRAAEVVQLRQAVIEERKAGQELRRLEGLEDRRWSIDQATLDLHDRIARESREIDHLEGLVREGLEGL